MLPALMSLHAHVTSNSAHRVTHIGITAELTDMLDINGKLYVLINA